jgi:hypothetical protein
MSFMVTRRLLKKKKNEKPPLGLLSQAFGRPLVEQLHRLF